MIPCACGNAWLDYAKEEVLPCLPWLKQVLHYDRVVVRNWRILFVPLVPMQPAKPITSNHARVILMKALGLAIRPLGGSFDELITCRNARLNRRACAEEQNRLRSIVRMKQRVEAVC